MKKDSVGSVIITYNPDASVIDNIYRIASQSEIVVIVDNNSIDFSILSELKKDIDSIEIIRLSYNSGIAHAMNVGVTSLIGRVEWIATFDQDTSIKENYFYEILSQFKRSHYNKDNSQEVILSPSFSGILEDLDYEDGTLRKVVTAISSGSVVRSTIFKKVGGFDDIMFIDYVDNEFCLRCKTYGIDTIEVSGVRLKHRLGNMSPHDLLGNTFHTSNHSALRRYYVYRNRIYVYKKYFLEFPKWVMRDSMRNFTEASKIIFWEEAKTEKLKMIFLGILDGLNGKMGKK